ncbi:MAG: hypothetical protein AAGB34_07595 [Planctomycetota bacterium]
MSEPIAVSPPTDEELAQLGQDLRKALTAIIEMLPEEDRTADKLAKRFPIDGAVARRMVRAVNAPSDPQVLARSPGIKQLRKLAQSTQSEALADALNRFDVAIKANGKSKAELTKRIRDNDQSEGVFEQDGEAEDE